MLGQGGWSIALALLNDMIPEKLLIRYPRLNMQRLRIQMRHAQRTTGRMSSHFPREAMISAVAILEQICQWQANPCFIAAVEHARQKQAIPCLFEQPAPEPQPANDARTPAGTTFSSGLASQAGPPKDPPIQIRRAQCTVVRFRGGIAMGSGDDTHPLFAMTCRGACQHATGDAHNAATPGTEGEASGRGASTQSDHPGHEHCRGSERPKRRGNHNRSVPSKHTRQPAEEPNPTLAPDDMPGLRTDEESEVGLRYADFTEELVVDSDRTLDTETESEEDLMASKVAAWRGASPAEEEADFAFYFKNFHQACGSGGRYVALAWSRMRLKMDPDLAEDASQAEISAMPGCQTRSAKSTRAGEM